MLAVQFRCSLCMSLAILPDGTSMKCIIHLKTAAHLSTTTRDLWHLFIVILDSKYSRKRPVSSNPLTLGVSARESPFLHTLPLLDLYILLAWNFHHAYCLTCRRRETPEDHPGARHQILVLPWSMTPTAVNYELCCKTCHKSSSPFRYICRWCCLTTSSKL